MNLITIRGLSVRYDRTEVLQDVNLDIYDDDFLGIVGPNGGGKTTLIKAIMGAVPYQGNITLAPDSNRPELPMSPDTRSERSRAGRCNGRCCAAH